jgi:hypothetical protein
VVVVQVLQLAQVWELPTQKSLLQGDIGNERPPERVN